MKILDIAFKDLRLSFRSRSALIFMFAIPMLITVLFYFMFGRISSDDGEFEVPQTAVALVNLDEGQLPGGDGDAAGGLGQQLAATLQGDDLSILMALSRLEDAAAARAAVDRQEFGVAVIIPADFTDAVTGLGPPVTVELYSDPTLTIGPAIVESIVGQIVDGYSAGASSTSITLEQLAEAGVPITGDTIQGIADEFGGNGLAQNATSLVVVEEPAGRENRNEGLAGILSLILGGMLVFYAFFTGANMMQSILTEQEKGTLQRLFTTPTSHQEIFSGKFVAALMILAVQVSVLLVFGRLAFGIHWGDPLPVALAAAGLILVAATAGLFLVSLFESSRQAGAIFGGLLTLTSMLGLIGVFTASAPNTPQSLKTLSLLVPQGWAVRGLQQAMDGRELNQILLTVSVLLVWSAVFFFIGQHRLRKRFA